MIGRIKYWLTNSLNDLFYNNSIKLINWLRQYFLILTLSLNYLTYRAMIGQILKWLVPMIGWVWLAPCIMVLSTIFFISSLFCGVSPNFLSPDQPGLPIFRINSTKKLLISKLHYEGTSYFFLKHFYIH